MDEKPTCTECGFSYVRELQEDEERHAQFHDEEMNGPLAADTKDGISIVTMDDSRLRRRVIERVFQVGRRDTPYEFSLFEAEEDAKNKPIAAIQIIGSRAIAGVLTRERLCQHRTLLESFMPDWDGLWRPTSVDVLAPEMRRSTEFIWVHKSRRGKGMLDDCLSAMSDFVCVPIVEFSHRLPFTADAYRFWFRRCPGAVYLADSD